jgi:hypothetical protein
MDWYLTYVLGLQPIEEIEVFRVGHRWHKMHESRNRGYVLEAVLADLRDTYNDDAVFNGGEWAYLNYSMMAYDWYYTADTSVVEESERRFEIPFHDTKIVGVMDRIEKHADGRRFVKDYKSAGGDIDASSDYWAKLQGSVQATMYTWAGQCLDLDIAGIEYDVWRKPAIRPKLLTQAATNKFLFDNPTYEKTPFDSKVTTDAEDKLASVYVEGEEAEIKNGKAGDQIRETPLMYGARLLNSMYKEPEKYFARKEVTRTTSDLQWFGVRLTAYYKQMKAVFEDPLMATHSDACDSKLCYHNRHNAVIYGDTPDGWKRRYKTPVTKLTEPTS